MRRRLVSILLALPAVLAPPLTAQVQPAAPPDPARIITAALEIIKAARYCDFVTIGPEGQPQARIVDPLVTSDPLTLWVGTNPLTRKVQQIEQNPRVTLLCFNPAGYEYVTILGRAGVVADSSRKASHWKPEWSGFYRDQYRGPDFMLIEVRPFRLEVVSPRHGLINDPRTWRPVVLDIPAGL